MNPFDLFGRSDAIEFFKQLEVEQERCRGTQRGFAVIRVEARAGVYTAREMLALYRTIAGALRSSDRVQPVGGRALAALLRDTDAAQAEQAGMRVRVGLAAMGDRWRAVVGWACATPGGASWEEAWRSAGILMVADGAVPAAA